MTMPKDLVLISITMPQAIFVFNAIIVSRVIIA